MKRRTLLALGFAVPALPATSLLGPAQAQRAPVTCAEPMAVPVSFREFSSDFGPRGRGFHSGIDLVAPAGTPIVAAAPGVVTHVGRWYGYGLMVDVRHADGLVTRYAHLLRFAPGVQPGSVLGTREVLGFVGRTGIAQTNHLHFEVRVDGRAVDPKPWIGWTAGACPPSRARIEEAFAGGARWNVRAPRPF
jgi:murein DD-endopeptidase MepM/ murein hydrolase activator NlpD